MRQLGFLHAVPKDQKKSRGEMWKEGGLEDLGLPSLPEEEYLLDLMLELGPTRENGMSEGPTDWNILYPFSISLGLDTEDTHILSEMCKAYYYCRESSKNPLSIAPVDQVNKGNSQLDL